jgi:hypothetical protein
MVLVHKSLRQLVAVAALVAGVTVVLVHASSATPPLYGELSNFDVYNDTGVETHGFEIDLEGVTPSDIQYTFGAPYERYGDPVVSATQTGVKVVYASGYDATTSTWAAGTPLAPNPIPGTGGHECWTGGSANYATAGCEHFGLGVSVTPTSVVYHWLLADPVTPGHLVQDATAVSIPAPSWSVSPPPAPAVNPQPVIAAVAPAPPPEIEAQMGDAIWVKVYYQESPSATDLGHLVSGDKQVPAGAGEVETEWILVQAGNGGGLAQELASEQQPGKQAESVVRRYQFFEYTGPYDPENHEATPVNDSNPQPSEIGNLIGNQMAALNLPAANGDHTKPVAVIDTKVATSKKYASLTVKFHATDVKNKSFTFYCKVDKAVPATCKSGKVVAKLAKGSHTLKVYAVDPSGNASKPASLSWKS